MTETIASLASELLDAQEWKLATRLEVLLGDNRYDAASLVEEIIPIYYEGNRTLDPDPIYRPFYYLHTYPDHLRFPELTRIFIENACWHLEGCLQWLTPSPPKYRGPTGPFGALLIGLYKAGVVPKGLAEDLMRFNKAVYVPAHHPSVLYMSRSSLDKSTFSVLEAAMVFVMMRKLSSQLFALLSQRGVRLPYGWKEFDDSWLAWNRTREQAPEA